MEVQDVNRRVLYNSGLVFNYRSYPPEAAKSWDESSPRLRRRCFSKFMEKSPPGSRICSSVHEAFEEASRWRGIRREPRASPTCIRLCHPFTPPSASSLLVSDRLWLCLKMVNKSTEHNQASILTCPFANPEALPPSATLALVIV